MTQATLLKTSKRTAIGIAAALVLTFSTATPALSFFEAGQRSYWPVTNEGISAKIDLSSWMFAPAIYQLGQPISPKVLIKNTSASTITVPIYLYVSKVIESPIGINIEDGTPGNDIADWQLNDNEQTNNDVQSMPTTYYVGDVTLLPDEEKEITYTFTTSEVGYYQVDFSTLVPGNGYIHGHIFAAGFIRVLNQGNNQGVTPTPTITSAPSATPTVATQNNSTSTATPTPEEKVQAAVVSAPTPVATTLPATGFATQTLLMITTLVGGVLSLAYGLTKRTKN